MTGSAVTIRGTRDGLFITFGVGEMDLLLAELQTLIARQEAFFRGGEVTLQFGGHRLASRDVLRALGILDRYGVSVRAILSGDAPTLPQAAAQEAAPESQVEFPIQVASHERGGILLKRTLRSGQSIHHAGHVVIIGDVNPGAQVVADGDIIVWGHLRGVVHAGAAGDQERCICALALSPTQLRIGDHIARPPENKRRRKKYGPERAFVSDGQIVAQECAINKGRV